VQRHKRRQRLQEVHLSKWEGSKTQGDVTAIMYNDDTEEYEALKTSSFTSNQILSLEALSFIGPRKSVVDKPDIPKYDYIALY